MTDPMIPVLFRILKVRRELSDVFTITLTPVEGSASPRFAPGQFNMLYAFGVGEVPISMSGDADSDGPLVHTIRAVGPVTEALEQLKAGDTVGVRGPFGTAWPVREAEGSDMVIVAGGIGLAPLRPAIYHVLTHRRKYGSVCIYYGARTPEDILFRAELEKWRGQFDLTVDVTVDRAAGQWAGKVGVVTRLISSRDFDPFHAIALICGPEVMMRYTVKTLNDKDVDNDRIYLSMERNMKCGMGLCGRCQWGPRFICQDGPVFRFDQIQDLFGVREL